jgi:hypothetical protein
MSACSRVRLVSRRDQAQDRPQETDLESHLALLREVDDVDVKGRQVVALWVEEENLSSASFLGRKVSEPTNPVVVEELQHPRPQGLDVLKVRVERNIEREALRGRARSSDVLDQLGVEDVVGQEDVFAVGPSEDSAQEEHLLDHVRVPIDVDSVSDVVRVLAKKRGDSGRSDSATFEGRRDPHLAEDEDARRENLLGSATDQPGEREHEGSGRGDQRGELGGLRKSETISRSAVVPRESRELRRTYDGGGEDEDADQQDDSNEDLVESSNGAVQVSHARGQRESLAVDLPE